MGGGNFPQNSAWRLVSRAARVSLSPISTVSTLIQKGRRESGSQISQGVVPAVTDRSHDQALSERVSERAWESILPGLCRPSILDWNKTQPSLGFPELDQPVNGTVSLVFTARIFIHSPSTNNLWVLCTLLGAISTVLAWKLPGYADSSYSYNLSGLQLPRKVCLESRRQKRCLPQHCTGGMAEHPG